MKTIRELNIKDWNGYFFKEMVNILDIEPEYFMINDFKGIKDGSTIFIFFIVKKIVFHMLFLTI